MTKPLLLILDDVAEVREWIAALVSARYPAWRVRTAENALAFQRAVDRERPTLVLLDEVLGPGEDVASLLQIMRDRQIFVALITGMEPANRLSAQLPEGVLDRLTKPVWSTEAGMEEFLADLRKVMTLTTRGRIG